MIEKSDYSLVRVGVASQPPFTIVYHHVQSCGVCSSWEGRYTSNISTLPLYCKCSVKITLPCCSNCTQENTFCGGLAGDDKIVEEQEKEGSILMTARKSGPICINLSILAAPARLFFKIWITQHVVQSDQRCEDDKLGFLLISWCCPF
jgi:hypothetical protein